MLPMGIPLPPLQVAPVTVSNVIGPWLQGYAVIAACVGEIGDLDMVYVHGICVCNQ